MPDCAERSGERTALAFFFPPLSSLIVLFAALAWNAPATADTITPVRMATELRGGRILMTDQVTGRTLIDEGFSRDHPIWTPGPGARIQPIAPAIDLAPRPDGFDLTATFTNPTDKARSLGVLSIPGLRFGRVIQSRFFYVDGSPYPIDCQNQPFYGGGSVYPGSIYSPVAVVGDDEYTIGVSLMYPLMDYKHRLWIRVEMPENNGAPDGLRWQVRFELNPAWGTGLQDYYAPEGELEPGETRTYRVAVRVLKRSQDNHPNAWLRLLEPYRLYFQSTYGPVTYLRDPRPVLAAAISYPGDINAENPYGFLGADLRPDRHGWEPWVTRFRNLAATGWRRFMMWAPSGQFYENRENNYPFQFTTGWQREPLVRDTLGLLTSFSHEVPELGLWWGHAANYMSRWDAVDTELLDPSNPIHMAGALAELDGAEAVDATMIGLDTFPRLPEWRSIPYLARLHERYPKMRFLAEPMPCDVLHRVAAGYILATRPQSQIGFQVTQPHLLADYMNPGHEIWGGVHEVDIQESLGIPQTQPLTHEQRFSVLRRYAAMGYVVAPYTAAALDDEAFNIVAAPSWETTVPPSAEPEEAVAPEVELSPVSVTVLPGTPVRFRARAIGLQNTYRWRRDGVFLANARNVDGADTPELVLAPAIGGDAGTYDVVVANPLGQAQSEPATLALVCETDFNSDGVVNPDDLSDFVVGYFGPHPPDPRADFNHDGIIDPDDLADYINAYFFGC